MAFSQARHSLNLQDENATIHTARRKQGLQSGKQTKKTTVENPHEGSVGRKFGSEIPANRAFGNDLTNKKRHGNVEGKGRVEGDKIQNGCSKIGLPSLKSTGIKGSNDLSFLTECDFVPPVDHFKEQAPLAFGEIMACSSQLKTKHTLVDPYCPMDIDLDIPFLEPEILSFPSPSISLTPSYQPSGELEFMPEVLMTEELESSTLKQSEPIEESHPLTEEEAPFQTIIDDVIDDFKRPMKLMEASIAILDEPVVALTLPYEDLPCSPSYSVSLFDSLIDDIARSIGEGRESTDYTVDLPFFEVEIPAL